MLSLNCKNVQHVKIYLHCNFEVNPITHFRVISLFSSNFIFLNTFRPLYKKNYKRQMLSLNCENVQHVEIYIPCNFEVKLITHVGVIALFSSFFFLILIFFVLYFKNYKRQMLSLNCKNVQHVKIYITYNFEVNPITRFGIIALFSSPV